MELGGKPVLKVEKPWINLLLKLGRKYLQFHIINTKYHSVFVMVFPDKVLPYRFHFSHICATSPLRLSLHLLWSLLSCDASSGVVFLLFWDCKLLSVFLHATKPLAGSFLQLLTPTYFSHLPPCIAIAYKGELNLECLPTWSTEVFKLPSIACRGGMLLCICTVLSTTPSSSMSLGITGLSLVFLPTESGPAWPVWVVSVFLNLLYHLFIAAIQ